MAYVRGEREAGLARSTRARPENDQRAIRAACDFDRDVTHAVADLDPVAEFVDTVRSPQQAVNVARCDHKILQAVRPGEFQC